MKQKYTLLVLTTFFTKVKRKSMHLHASIDTKIIIRQIINTG